MYEVENNGPEILFTAEKDEGLIKYLYKDQILLIQERKKESISTLVMGIQQDYEGKVFYGAPLFKVIKVPSKERENLALLLAKEGFVTPILIRAEYKSFIGYSPTGGFYQV